MVCDHNNKKHKVGTGKRLSTEVHERSSVKDELLAADVNLYVTLKNQSEVVGRLAVLVQSPSAFRIRHADADNDVLVQQASDHSLRHD